MDQLENWTYFRPNILPSGNLKSQAEGEEEAEDNKDVEKTAERLVKLDSEKDKDLWKKSQEGIKGEHKIDNKPVS